MGAVTGPGAVSKSTVLPAPFGRFGGAAGHRENEAKHDDPSRSHAMPFELRWSRKHEQRYLLDLACGMVLLIVGVTATVGEPVIPRPQENPTAIAPDRAAPHPTDCLDCHYCARPTPEDKCLRNPCARHEPVRVTINVPEVQGPDVVILDELEDAYLPVPFDHKGHARMAEMTEGCSACHHYTPEGGQHPACKTCHEVSTAGTDIGKPGLKGAYHQQCLNCHREWIDETDCAVCHMRKADGARDARAATSPTKDDILGLMHPPIPEPDTDIYRGVSSPVMETQVVFRHQEHVNRFGLDCVNCHHESSCASCHSDAEEQRRPRTVTEHHRPCIRCHKRDMDLAGRSADRCSRCHWRRGQPKPESFDHADTGWVLAKYHERANCRQCHQEVPFVGMDKDCRYCHGEWGAETFDHGVTGQTLDENHAEIDCDVCHAEHQFDRAPVCDDCHDEEDDGIAYPARRPGPHPNIGASPPKRPHSAQLDEPGQEEPALQNPMEPVRELSEDHRDGPSQAGESAG